MDAPTPHWRPTRMWRALMVVARVGAALVCRLRVTGEVAPALRDGPLVLASNHIGVFDPVALVAACRTRRVVPRMMATGGLFRAPVVGAVMRACGHIPVNRGHADVADAVHHAADAVRAGSVVLIYPEGRISLDPGMWPERAKTGLARFALATGAAVVPVAQWGAHEMMAYHGRGAMIGTLLRSAVRRPLVRVHFGAPVDLSDLRPGAVGHAQRASERIMAALAAELAALRPAEPRLPRYVDPTRPLSVARVYRRRPVVPASAGIDVAGSIINQA